LTTETDVLERARLVAEAALARKGRNIVVLDVGEVTAFADAFVIVTGTSDRHARAVADAVVECAKAHGNPPLGIEGYGDGEWVLIDLNDIIVHVFQGEARGEYDLERLWADAPATIHRDDDEEREGGGDTAAESTAR
jgi:ribosome-associated protein